ncbi:MAG: hypothetical protein ACPG21_12455 [Crocinitomicaceae bacterium]
MLKQVIFLLTIVVLIAGCNSDSGKSDMELINQNVVDFLMLEDSVEVSTAIEDTVYVENLNEMITQTEKNLNLIGLDLDTLSSLIDAVAYQKLAIQEAAKNTADITEDTWKDSLQKIEIQLLQLQLQQARLANQENQFKQTNRVLFQLKRSVWANVAGFHVRAKYAIEKNTISMGLLLDANMNVVE